MQSDTENPFQSAERRLQQLQTKFSHQYSTARKTQQHIGVIQFFSGYVCEELQVIIIHQGIYYILYIKQVVVKGMNLFKSKKKKKII